MYRYIVKANVTGSGTVQHVIKANSKAGAENRIRAAYPTQEVHIISVIQ